MEPEAFRYEGLVSPLEGACLDCLCGVLVNTASPLPGTSFKGDMGGVGLRL